MNRAIIVREKVTRLIKLLVVDKGVQVTQRGVRAYVEYNPSGTPRLVNIPYIPDDASEEFLSAIEGFLDHEVAHVMFTDYKALGKAKKLGVAQLHNIIEDAFIEKKMAATFAGSGLNLKNVGDFFLKSYTDKRLKEDPENALSYLMVPAIRALSGQVVYKDYMSDKWRMMNEVMDRAGKYLEEALPNIKTSLEGVDVALKVKELLEMPDEPADEESPGSGKSKKSKEGSSSEKGEKGEGEDGGSSSDDGDEDDSPEGDASDEGEEKDSSECEDKDEESSSGGEGGDSEDESEGEPEERDDMDFDDEIEEKDEGHTGEDEGDDPADGDDKEGGPEEGKKDGGPSADHEDSAPPSYKDLFGDDSDSSAYDEKLAELLSKMAESETKSADYTVYTKDLDKIEPMKVGEQGRWDDSMLKDMQDSVDHMLGPLQKDLERAIAAKSATVWASGLRSGRLNAGALARLTTFGDERAFRRKHISDSKDVAVTLVVDCSGSMHGKKIETAAFAAYGLSSVLDRMNINHEVLGFTTEKMLPSAMRDEEAKTGIRYSRYMSLYIPIFKAFGDRLGTTERKRFAALPSVYWLNENVDGESVQIAASRLLQRREKRKILIVLSDGQPACPSGKPMSLHSHLKKTVADIERQGVDVLGIGICSDAPKRYYSKSLVLNKIEELPTTVIKEIKRLLMQ